MQDAVSEGRRRPSRFRGGYHGRVIDSVGPVGVEFARNDALGAAASAFLVAAACTDKPVMCW